MVVRQGAEDGDNEREIKKGGRKKWRKGYMG
jgi:hypothetical protein